MTEIDFKTIFNTTELEGASSLSGKEKLDILRRIFQCPLDQVDFWDIYQIIRKLRLFKLFHRDYNTSLVIKDNRGK
ncbi:MAG: hypothetical protein ACFFD2_28515 [Promethearchaeota archaeon]